MFIFKKFSKMQAWLFLQIPLNFDQHLNLIIFFFRKKRGVFWKFWQDLATNPNGVPLSETFGNLDTLV